MDQIIKSIQQLLLDHMSATQLLMSNLPPASTIVSVANSSRFRPGDEALLTSQVLGLAEKVTIKSIPDYNQIELLVPTTNAWTVASASYILKAVNWLPLQKVYLGALPVQPRFPSITVSCKSESVPDWATLQATNHDYKITIRTFVMADNFEQAEVFLPKFSKQVREILLDHIHPIINGISQPLTADVPVGAKVISVPSTAGFAVPSIVVLRDAKVRKPAQESVVRSILSPTAFEIVDPLQYDYALARGAEAIYLTRWLYDTRVTDINYGYTQKPAGMLRGAEISYYAKEEIIRSGNILT